MTCKSNGTMGRADLVEAIHRKSGVPRSNAADMVEQILGRMAEALEAGGDVKVTGFGSFLFRDKGARVGRNPRTGIEAPITPRRVLTFRASDRLRATIVAAEDGAQSG